MKLLGLFSFLLLFFSVNLFSQDIDYAKRCIKKLSSPEFNGRGYADEADKIAAGYIALQFDSLKLLKFNNDYFQKFPVSVNSITNVSISVGDSLLVPGVDYMVGGESPSIKGEFPIEYLDSKVINDKGQLLKFLFKDLSKSFVAIDTTGVIEKDIVTDLESIRKDNLCKAKGLISFSEGKLTYHISDEEKAFATIRMNPKKLNHAAKIKVNIKSKLNTAYQTQNIVAYIQGEIDSFIVFTAHYDHLGRMGKDVYFPGANDNASGVAMAIDFARNYASLGKKPHYSIAVILLSAEELGLLGSSFYVNNPLFPLSKIKFLFDLDMVGTGEKGIKVVNGSIFKPEFELLQKINNADSLLPVISARGEAAISDHYYFYKSGVKSFFIYTQGGIAEYHNIYDKAETLPLTEYANLFKLILKFVDRY